MVLVQTRTTRLNRPVRVPHVRASVRGPIMNYSNAFTKRVEAFEGLRPSFSAHVRWREHGAPGQVCLVLLISLLEHLSPAKDAQRDGERHHQPGKQNCHLGRELPQVQPLQHIPPQRIDRRR
jgi:hypothetical protein